MPQELIHAGGRTLYAYVHKLINNIWNNDESIIIPIYKNSNNDESIIIRIYKKSCM